MRIDVNPKPGQAAAPDRCYRPVDEGRGPYLQAAGIFGDILCPRMEKRGVTALVADGVVRDVAGVLETNLPAWCAGVAVFPDDIIVLDQDGAVLIPAALLDTMLAEAPEQERMEAWIMTKIDEGRPLPGLYPLDNMVSLLSPSSHDGTIAFWYSVRGGGFMDLRFERLKHLDQLLAIESEWRELWARSPGDYYLSFESVLLSWEKIHEPRRRRICAVVVRDGATLVGILPMILYRRALWRIASPIGPDSAEGADILLAEGSEPSVADALFRFFVSEVRPDVIALAFVREGNALDRAVRNSGIAPVITQTDTIPYAVLHGEANWKSYERSLSRSTQQQTARKRRRMEETGAVTFEVVEGAADASIEWLLDEKAKWGRKVGKHGPWLFSADYRAYLKAYVARGAHVLTFVLRLDEAPAAVKVIVVGPSLCTLVIAAYDETLSNFSPGNILDQFWIEHIFENFRRPDGRRLDISFGNGVERYKMHWGRGFGFGSTSYKLPVSLWGRMPYHAKAAIRTMSRYAKPVTNGDSGEVASKRVVRATKRIFAGLSRRGAL